MPENEPEGTPAETRPREVPTCNAPVLNHREPDACGARSSYVIVLSTGPVFSCKRHISIALDARHAESWGDVGGAMAIVWSAQEWRYADMRSAVEPERLA